MVSANRFRLPACVFFVLCAIACLLGATGCRKEQKPAPGIDQLSESLQRSAEKSLNSGSLASSQLRITAAPDRAAFIAKDVNNQVSAYGGAAIETTGSDGSISILATIPDDNAPTFQGAVEFLAHAAGPDPDASPSNLSPAPTPMNSNPSKSSTLIEILIVKPTPGSQPHAVIALSFALPEESRGILRLIGDARRLSNGALPVVAGNLAGREVIVLHTGMGMKSATARAGQFLEKNSPTLWIAAGFAGGLSPELRLGDIVAVKNFSDSAPFDSIASLPARAGALVTTKEVIQTAEQKRDLCRHTGAIAVDMETAAIHRACAARNVPTLAIRAISDTADEDLPVPAEIWFDMARQRPRPVRLVTHLATHPGRILPFARFVRGLGPARESLTHFLISALEAQPL